jgi:hypothetical protein
LSYQLDLLAQEAVSGGVPKDGIPAIDEPQFMSVERANDFLKADDVVFGAVINGEAKAYPQRVLVWHEIVNDRIGGRNVSVTYCPLTGTAIGFERGDTTLGISGNLVNSNLIMYDRATDSHWPQVLGAAVSGPLKGKALPEFPVVWTTWEKWRAAHPETQVLSQRTGYARDYSRDPYGGYTPTRGYYAKGDPIFAPLHRDQRLEPKTVVAGARTGLGAVAFHKDKLRDAGVAHLEHKGSFYTATYDILLDTVHIYRNPEQLEFTQKDGQYQHDDENFEAKSLPLTSVNTFDAMWFAWAGFFPETGLYE